MSKCRYCGRRSAYPFGAQQICLRCEAIQQDFETSKDGKPIRRSDTEMLLHVQNVIKRQEIAAHEKAEFNRVRETRKKRVHARKVA